MEMISGGFSLTGILQAETGQTPFGGSIEQIFFLSKHGVWLDGLEDQLWESMKNLCLRRLK